MRSFWQLATRPVVVLSLTIGVAWLWLMGSVISML
jgi:hypothetical protein